MERARADLILRDRLEDRAAEWQAAGGDPALLLPPGKPLLDAEDWRARLPGDATPAITADIEASRAAADAAAAAAAARARRERTRLRVAATVFAVLALGASVAGWLAYRGEQRAEAQTQRAEAQRDAARTAQSQWLATEALAALEAGDAEGARALAAAGLEAPGALSAAWAAPRRAPLLRAQGASRLIARARARGNPLAISPDGTRLFAPPWTGSLGGLIDLETGARVASLSGLTVASTGQFAPDGATLLVTAGPLVLLLLDGRTGAERARLDTSGSAPRPVPDEWLMADDEATSVVEARILANGRALVRTFDGRVFLWRPGGEVRLFPGERRLSPVVHLSADGRRLAIVAGGEVRIFDVGTGDLVTTLSGHQNQIGTVRLSDDGARAYTGSLDGNGGLWDVATGGAIALPHGGDVRQTLPFGERVRTVASGETLTVRFWDARDGSALESPAGTLISDPEDLRLLALEDPATPGLLRLHDPATGARLRELTGHAAALRGVVLSDDGTRLLSWDRDGTALLWDVATGAELVRLDPPPATPSDRPDAAFGPDGTLVTYADGPVARVWDAADGAPLAALHGADPDLASVRTAGPGRLITVGVGGDVALWRLADPLAAGRFVGHRGPVTGRAVAPDGRTLASASSDGSVRLWDIASGAELWSGAAFGADFTRLLLVRPDAALVIDAATGGELASFPPPDPEQGATRTAALSPDGRLIATGHDDGRVLVRDVATGATILAANGQAPSFAFTRDGDHLLTRTFQGQAVQVWRLSDARRIADLPQDLSASGFELSPDGTILATADTLEIRLWDVATWQILAVLPFESTVAARFAPDSRSLVVSFGENGADLARATMAPFAPPGADLGPHRRLTAAARQGFGLPAGPIAGGAPVACLAPESGLPLEESVWVPGSLSAATPDPRCARLARPDEATAVLEGAARAGVAEAALWLAHRAGAAGDTESAARRAGIAVRLLEVLADATCPRGGRCPSYEEGGPAASLELLAEEAAALRGAALARLTPDTRGRVADAVARWAIGDAP